MKTYKNKVIHLSSVETISCDVCKRVFNIHDFQTSHEVEEFVHIEKYAGYGSIFEDADKIELDICQHCLKEKLGDFIRISEA